MVQARGGAEALDLCAGRSFDLLICDYQMAPMNGVQFLRELAGSGLGEATGIAATRGFVADGRDGRTSATTGPSTL